MTPRSDLEIQGSFLTHPFAELLVEIEAARLNGSLRVEEKDKKIVVYFKSGRVVFAVSNARSSRIFEMLIDRGRLTADDIALIPNYQRDFELIAYLQEKEVLTRADCKRLVSEQIQQILIEVLSWEQANWTFSSLARIRDGLQFDVPTDALLLDYSRTLTSDCMLGRFRSLDETFGRSEKPETSLYLSPEEAFVLSRADYIELTASEIAKVAAMPETEALHLIYNLWLAGLLVRREWQPAFSAEAIAAMRTAKLELKQEAKFETAKAPVVPQQPEPEQVVEPAPALEPEKSKEPTITVDDYLRRVEKAATYYDILGVDSLANVAEIKKAYFSLARLFHPDRFHAEGGLVFERVQSAFTELAQAHETLKNPETREVYDYRMRKELAARRTSGTGNTGLSLSQAAEDFEAGNERLQNGDAAGAVPYLARAVHYDPSNARYHASYGKALSFDREQRYKSESELQTAIKLDPTEPSYRLYLAEFFIQFNLMKRAEGELNRLLVSFPGNQQARKLLDSLNK